MSDNEQLERKHLLWWVLYAINAYRVEGIRPDTLLSETLWDSLDAPDWVLPAIREKYKQMQL